MSVLTPDQMVTYLGMLVQDADGVQPGLTTQQKLDLINEAYQDFASLYHTQFTSNLGISFTYPENVRSTIVSEFTGLKPRAPIRLQTTTTQLERLKIWEILRLQETYTDQAPLRFWAAEPYLVLPYAQKIYGWPVPLAEASCGLFCEVYPDDLVLGGLGPMTGDAEARWITRMGAANAAAVAGRPQPFIDNITRALPQALRSLIESKTKPQMKPRARPEETGVIG